MQGSLRLTAMATGSGSRSSTCSPKPAASGSAASAVMRRGMLGDVPGSVKRKGRMSVTSAASLSFPKRPLPFFCSGAAMLGALVGVAICWACLRSRTAAAVARASTSRCSTAQAATGTCGISRAPRRSRSVRGRGHSPERRRGRRHLRRQHVARSGWIVRLGDQPGTHLHRPQRRVGGDGVPPGAPRRRRRRNGAPCRDWPRTSERRRPPTRPERARARRG